MPESRKRKKAPVQHREGFEKQAPEEPKASPKWWAPTMSTLMIVGLLWIVVTYLTKFQYPLPLLAPLAAGNGNLIFGFVVLLAGFLMTLRWR
ncbi:MAG TPA: cell division protein CrgA [Actinomycetaceae bacterium]|nr:cell division protein CrgA [Actinomycetaceae bacterium]